MPDGVNASLPLFSHTRQSRLEEAFGQLVEGNPLPDATKHNVLASLLGPGVLRQILFRLGKDRPATLRPLTAREQLTIDALHGRVSDTGNRQLLHAIRQSQGEELIAWSDLAAFATQASMELAA